MIHEVKCTQPWFGYACSGVKPFEVRKNDRDYHKGDIIVLKEYDPSDVFSRVDDGFTGHEKAFEITIVIDNDDFTGVQPGYCVMGLRETRE